MPEYKFTAFPVDKKKEIGQIEADNREKAAAIVINSYGNIPIQITEVKKKIWNTELSLTSEAVKPKDILFFTRQLLTLLGAGLTLLDSLETILQQVKNPKFQKLLRSLKIEVAGGKKLSEALAKYPREFSQVYVSMMNVGERGGLMVEILKRLTSLIEDEQAVKSKVNKATRYPKMVIGALLIAFIVLIMFVFPTFAKMFTMFKTELPLPTRIMIAINNFFQAYWPYVFGGALIVWLALRKFFRTEAGLYFKDRISLKIPIIGPLVQKVLVSRFARIFAMLNASGLPILEALKVVSRTTDNRIIARELDIIRDKIREGKGISTPMRESKIFPLTITNMVAIGERSGNLSEMLNKVADYFDEEIDNDLDNMSAYIEPILIAFLASMVLFIALSVFLPMWSLMDVMK